MSKNRYVNKYLEDKKHLTLSDDACGHIDLIKRQLGFKSNNQTVQYLLDLEKDLRELNLIKEVKVCEKCGVPIDVKLDSYKGITHQHIDSKSNCFGCITTKHRVKTKIDVLPGTIETKTKPTEQTEQTDQTDQVGPIISF